MNAYALLPFSVFLLGVILGPLLTEALHAADRAYLARHRVPELPVPTDRLLAMSEGVGCGGSVAVGALR